jgi:hypothetical protein
MSHNNMDLHGLLQRLLTAIFISSLDYLHNVWSITVTTIQIVWQIKMACKMEAHLFRKSEDCIYYVDFVNTTQ